MRIPALTLRKKIYLMLALSALFFAGLASVTYSSLEYVSQKYENLSRTGVDAQRYIMLTRDVEALKRHVQKFTVTGETSLADEAERVYSKIMKIVSETTLQTDKPIQKYVASITRHLQKYHATFKALKKQYSKQQKLRRKVRIVAEELQKELLTLSERAVSTDQRYWAMMVHMSMLEAEREMLRYFTTVEYNYVARAKKVLEKGRMQLQKLIHKEQDLARSEQLRKIAGGLEAYEKSFISSVQHTRGYMFLIDVVMAAESYEVLYNAKIISSAVSDMIQRINGEMNTHISQVTGSLSIAALVFLVLLILLSFLILRSIVRPVGQLTETFLRLSEGATDAEIPDYVTKDELGALTKAAAVFQKRNRETETLLQESRRLGDELLLSERRLRLATESAKIGIWDYNLQNRSLSWDDMMFDLYGIEKEQFSSTYETWQQALHPEDASRTEAVLEDAILNRRIFDTVFRIIRPDGDVRFIQAYAFTLYDEQQQPIQTIGVNYDITDAKTLEHKLEERVREEVVKQREQELVLIQQSKLAAMGEMISAISHQWRQPLNSVALYLHDLISAEKSGELDRSYLQESVSKSLEQVNYMSHTIEDFRHFFKPDTKDTTFDVEDVINDAIRLFRAQLENNFITIALLSDSGEHQLQGNANHLRQVLLNLISNAVDAIKERKDQSRETFEGHVSIGLQREGDLLRITVDDNGNGVSNGALERVFEPYFTTKEEGKGSGIGLYMTRTILEKYFEASIRMKPLEQGARIVVDLPLQDAP